MTSSELPAWTADVNGFDPDRRWLPLVCTNHKQHRIELLGILFEPTHSNGVHWAGGHVYREDDVGIANTQVWRTDDTTDEEAEVIRELEGKGSMHVRCPHGCTPRISREDFVRLIEEAWRVGVGWVDLSLYG